MSRTNAEEKSALDYPDLSIVFSQSLADKPWFAPLSVMIGDSNLCGIAFEDTFSELIFWKSTSDEFIDDQAILIFDLKDFTARVRLLDQEIADWPGKLGRRFVTMVVMLEGREKISADTERRIIAAQLDSLFNVHAVHGVRELYNLLTCMTKATARKFSSRQRNEVLGFEENRRTASNPADVWPGVLEMFFSQAAGPLARAIASKFPSPWDLKRELLR
ncbi:hypothetical protein BIW11_11992, partial [Tropilaelaps mercedesae]